MASITPGAQPRADATSTASMNPSEAKQNALYTPTPPPNYKREAKEQHQTTPKETPKPFSPSERFRPLPPRKPKPYDPKLKSAQEAPGLPLQANRSQTSNPCSPSTPPEHTSPSPAPTQAPTTNGASTTLVSPSQGGPSKQDSMLPPPSDIAADIAPGISPDSAAKHAWGTRQTSFSSENHYAHKEDPTQPFRSRSKTTGACLGTESDYHDNSNEYTALIPIHTKLKSSNSPDQESQKNSHHYASLKTVELSVSDSSDAGEMHQYQNRNKALTPPMPPGANNDEDLDDLEHQYEIIPDREEIVEQLQMRAASSTRKQPHPVPPMRSPQTKLSTWSEKSPPEMASPSTQRDEKPLTQTTPLHARRGEIAPVPATRSPQTTRKNEKPSTQTTPQTARKSEKPSTQKTQPAAGEQPLSSILSGMKSFLKQKLDETKSTRATSSSSTPSSPTIRRAPSMKERPSLGTPPPRRPAPPLPARPPPPSFVKKNVNREAVRKLDQTQVLLLLEAMNLAEFKPFFVKHQIDGQLLLKMTPQQFEEAGMNESMTHIRLREVIQGQRDVTEILGSPFSAQQTKASTLPHNI